MANAQRRKGLRGEAEVAAIWRFHGFHTLGLESGGDHTISREPDIDAFGNHSRRDDVRIHSEVKRQNRLRTEWIAQAEREAPVGAVPVVAWRPDLGRWWAMIPLEDLARLLA